MRSFVRPYINKYIIKGLKYIIITVSILFFTGYIIPVIALKLPVVQRYLTNVVERELSGLLGDTPVKVGSVEASWLNRLVIKDLRIDGSSGENILTAGNITAGFRLLPMLRNRWIITTVRLFGLTCHIRQDTPGGETNLQPLIDALARRRSNDSRRSVEVQVHTILIRRSSLTCDLAGTDNTRHTFNPNHLNIRNISGRLSLHHYSPDSIHAHVNRLSFDEISGLRVERLTARLTASRDTARLDDLTLRLPHSSINVPQAAISLSSHGPHNLDPGRASVAALIAPSTLSPQDLAPFLPNAPSLTDRIDFAAGISGTLDDLTIDRLDIRCGTDITLQATAGIRGLTGAGGREPYVLAQIRRLNVRTEALQHIAQTVGSRTLRLPAELLRAGELTFTGEISGFTDHLVTFGTLSSPVAGDVRIDLLAGAPRDGAIYIKGNIASTRLQIAALLQPGNPFGTAAFSAEVDITQPAAGRPLHGRVKARADGIDCRGYRYENIRLSGTFGAGACDATLHIADPNAHLDLRGRYATLHGRPQLDLTATIRHLRPDLLHLTDRYDHPELSLDLTASLAAGSPDLAAGSATFAAGSPDDIQGHIELRHLTFATHEGRIHLPALRLESTVDDRRHRRMHITSDVINGEITGQYTFSSLAGDLLRTAGHYLPSPVRAAAPLLPSVPADADANRFDFLLMVENTDTISTILRLPVAILRPSTLRGQYSAAANTLHLDALIPRLRLGATTLDDLRLHLDNAAGLLLATLTASQDYRGSTQNHLRLSAVARGDSIDAALHWTNDRESRFEAALRATALFVDDGPAGALRTEITLPAAQIILRDSLWNIEPASLTIAGGRILIDNFYLTSGNQHIHLDGTISRDPAEPLLVDLNDIELAHIFDVLNIPTLQFGGRATGAFSLHDLTETMRIEGRLEVLDFSFNRAVQGRLSLSSQWDADRQGILLLGSIYSSDTTWTDVNGYIYPIGPNRGLSLYFDANDINLAFLQRYMAAFSDEVSGHLYGNVHLYGSFSRVCLRGAPCVRDARIRLNLLNTAYTFSDTVHIDSTTFRTQNTVLHDTAGNTGQLSFTLTHDCFRDMTYDLSLKLQNMLVYDVPETVNPQIFGQVYAGGTARISGTDDFIRVEGNLRTDAGTSVGFNFTENPTAATYDFITFTPPPAASAPAAATAVPSTDTAAPSTAAAAPAAATAASPAAAAAPAPTSPMDYELNFLVSVTPDARLELAVAAGEPDDRIRATGSGDIRIRYGSRSDLQIFGNYLITEGTYNFSLQQVIRKRFDLRDGGLVTFRGDPMSAALDISALYSLTANIQDLDETFLMETANPSIPVNCILHLDGHLRNPAITFDIELPSSNSEMERQVKSFIDTEDMMTRQIIYLLVLNKFYTPDYSHNDYRSNEFSAVASSALSAQLSGLLSSLTDKVQIGTNIRSRQDGIKDTEVEMLLSSRLLNNRLLFNGNFGYKDNTVMTNAFVGEFDLEYRFMRNREISLKAYNHANDLYRYNTKSLTRQGVGIMFRKDFSSLTDLFMRRKKEEEPAD
jgi:hypothetical protein